MRGVVLIFFTCCLFLSGCSLSTDNYVGRGDGYLEKAPRKLGRGITNIVSSPLEIPNQSLDMAYKSETAPEQAAGYFGGLFVGMGYCVGRIFSGVYDVVTSPLAGPSAPTLEDELITSDFVNECSEKEDKYSPFYGLNY